jgi:hypothetical protein
MITAAKVASVSLFLSVGIAVSSARAAPVGSCGAVSAIEVNWRDAKDDGGKGLEDKIRRINVCDNRIVSIRVVQFNFLSYSLKYDVQTKTSDSFNLLTLLWRQILGGVGGGLAAQPPDLSTFEGVMEVWNRLIRQSDSELQRFLDGFTANVVLVEKDVESAKSAIELLGSKRVEALDDLQSKALALAKADQFAAYDKTLVEHKKIALRLQSFQTLANKCVNGDRYTVGSYKAGTAVTVTLTPTALSGGDAGSTVSFGYLVRSQLPVLVHVGYSSSSLKNITFQQVTSLAQQSLYQLETSKNPAPDLMLGMTLELKSFGANDNFAIGPTIQTSILHPAERLDFGFSLRVIRLVLTVAWSGRNTVQGQGSVSDPITGTTAVRELFSSLGKSWEHSVAYGIAFRVF